MRFRLSAGQTVLAVLSTIALAALATNPAVLDRARAGISGIDAAEPSLLWLGALAFACAHIAAGLAWRTALAPLGVRTGPVDAVSRHCVGSLVNSVAPAQLGGGVRVALYARLCGPAGHWKSAGTAAAVGSTHSIWIALVSLVAVFTGAVPRWALILLAGAILLAVGAAIVARRLTGRAWLANLAAAFTELGRTPRTFVAVAACTGCVTLARVAAAGAVVTAFGIDRPLLVAVVVVAALDLAAILPLTPGNIGVAAAAVAFALGAQGIDTGTAISTGVALSGIETLTSVALGLGGLVALSARRVPPLVARSATVIAATGVVSAFGATVLLPAL